MPDGCLKFLVEGLPEEAAFETSADNLAVISLDPADRGSQVKS